MFGWSAVVLQRTCTNAPSPLQFRRATIRSCRQQARRACNRIFDQLYNYATPSSFCAFKSSIHRQCGVSTGIDKACDRVLEARATNTTSHPTEIPICLLELNVLLSLHDAQASHGLHKILLVDKVSCRCQHGSTDGGEPAEADRESGGSKCSLSSTIVDKTKCRTGVRYTEQLHFAYENMTIGVAIIGSGIFAKEEHLVSLLSIFPARPIYALDRAHLLFEFGCASSTLCRTSTLTVCCYSVLHYGFELLVSLMICASVRTWLTASAGGIGLLRVDLESALFAVLKVCDCLGKGPL